MTYKEKIIKIFDKIRTKDSVNKGCLECFNISCRTCPFKNIDDCNMIIYFLSKYDNFQDFKKTITNMKKIIDTEIEE